MREQRSQQRYNYTDIAEYIVEDEVHAEPADDFHRCVTLNISRAGACIYTFDPIERWQIVRFKSGILPLPITYAIVRWIDNIHDDCFMAGLMFL